MTRASCSTGSGAGSFSPSESLCVSLFARPPAALAAALVARPAAADPGAVFLLPRLGRIRLAALAAAGDLEQRILLELRLPRALLALLAGALACGGAVLQVMLHNPVAEPGLLGVSSGAGLAAMVAMAVAKALGVYLPGWGCRWRPSAAPCW